jgi:5-deoxy-glucuronate isomerase
MAHPALIDRFREGFGPGFTEVTREGEASVDTGIDFGIWVLRNGEAFEQRHPKESAWVLLRGEATLRWDGGEAKVARSSLFEEPPTVLHLPANAAVAIDTASSDSEWAVARAHNPARFAPRLFLPQELTPEYRGAELVQGACLRNVRLVFDKTVRPESNLVLGEVVNYPGRWSSYPPHHHGQPEIYHYRFTLPQGYGHAELGEQVLKVRPNDTLKISGGLDHAQASAPGYGMYYLWVVRHLEGAPYLGFEFTEEHRWILDPANQGWEPRR